MSDQTDTSIDPAVIRSAWFALADRVAVASGSAVGLISLYAHSRVHTACIRGFTIFFLVRLVAKFGFWALEHALPGPDDTQGKSVQ